MTEAPATPVPPAEPIHLSVVSPVYRAQDCLRELYRRTSAACDELTAAWELILVDDASPDESWRLIAELSAADPRVRGLQLARNFGQHHAITAGLVASRGDWVVVMDCDLQDRPEEIPRMYRKAVEEGHLCVMARRQVRTGSVISRLQSWGFYKVFGYLTDLPQYDGSVSNFSLVARQVVDEIVGMREAVRFYPGFLFWLGFGTGFVDVQHDPRFAGKTSYTLRKLLHLAQSVILAHSTKPLRLAVALGLWISTLAFVTGFLVLIHALLHGSPVTGWASLMVSMWFLSGIIILTLGVVGLYVGGISSEVKGRPFYVVRRRTFDA